jgi:hypothetical protein
VRSLDDLQKMVHAGATRIGASASVKILEQAHGGASGASAAEHAAKPTPEPVAATRY